MKKIRKILLSCLSFRTRSHNLMVRKVTDYLHDLGIPFSCYNSLELKSRAFKGVDLVITVGGDGTFLRASHYIRDDTLLFGINSDPRVKEGFFTRSDKTDFKKKIRMVLEGKNKITELTRISTKIGNKILKPSLNEVYVGSDSPYLMSRYYLDVNCKKEYQKSSGVLVGTACGTHAWLGSAGARKLPIKSSVLQYVVRDPYIAKHTSFDQVKGIVDSGKVIITPHKMDDCIVVIDSLSKEHKLEAGKKVEISRSPLKLNMVDF